jgi:hypothetical protein
MTNQSEKDKTVWQVDGMTQLYNIKPIRC